VEIIDVKTVFIIYVITNALCASVMASLWLQNRKRFPAISLWLIDFILQFIAILLVLLRGIVPDFLSIVLANTFVVGGTVILYIGLERYAGKRSSQIHNYVMVGVFMLVHAYLTFVYPRMDLRNVNLSIGLFYICLQGSWLMLRQVEQKMRAAARPTGVILAIFCLVSLVRIIVDLLIPQTVELFKSHLFDTLVIIIYQILFIALTFALFTLVNRRLSIALEDDIVEREQAQNSLRESEEKYRSILDNILEGYFETDLKGNIIFANNSACNLLGYDKETLYKINYRQFSTPDTKNKFQETYGEVLRTGNPSKISEYEIIRGDGIIRINELSVALLRNSAGKTAGFRTVARDITDKKQVAELIRIRLSLFEFAANHPLEELLQKTLDEVGVLVNSPIGFYHFLEEDQETLSLQAWSTRTLNEFCKAEGKGMHYAIDQAGVWVDCVRERKAVVHNDYNSLPHRRGLPEGHAAVIRELVVPIIRGKNIVAILGVGNKPTEYNQKDIEIVSYLADVAYVIAERKKAEEALSKYSNDLKERMKEINCLYSVSEIIRRENITQEEILTLCPDIISQAYRFPEITASRIIWRDHEYKTKNFRKTKWSQSFEIMVYGKKVGSIEIYCLGGKDQECYDDFFLAEERDLLKNIADLLGRSAERKQAEEQIKHMATHDSLTDLPSLKLAEDRLAMAMGLASRHKEKVAVMFIDLDGFKEVNDTLGHEAGDFLLKTLAQRFLSSIRKTDTISRIGGDEFLLIATELKSADDAVLIAKKLLKQAAQPFIIDGHNASVSASIGIAFYPDHGEDINELIKLADEAMYRIKNGGKNGFVFVKK
jgi:diguanylate cyclase (GGDEF)-like protein/PAS domain S-box-containing protein